MEMNDAIKEAYEYAPADVIYYDTLEIDHESFIDSIKVVRSYEELVTNQGTYYPVMFDFQLPDIQEAARGSMKISIAGIPRTARELIRAAAQERAPITVKYRQYMKGDMEPDAYLPFPLTIAHISETHVGLEAEALMPDLTNMYFPRRLMTTENLPGLRM